MTEWDIQNWFALVIELSIGIPLAVFLSIFFYRKQQKISAKLEKIITEQKETSERRTNYAYNRIRSEIDRMESWINRVNGLVENYHNEIESIQDPTSEENIVVNYKSWFGFANFEREDNIRNLENIIGFSYDVIDPSLVEEINTIILLGKEFVIPWYRPEFQPTIPPRSETTPAILGVISSLRSKLPNNPI